MSEQKSCRSAEDAELDRAVNEAETATRDALEVYGRACDVPLVTARYAVYRAAIIERRAAFARAGRAFLAELIGWLLVAMLALASELASPKIVAYDPRFIVWVGASSGLGFWIATAARLRKRCSPGGVVYEEARRREVEARDGACVFIDTVERAALSKLFAERANQ